MNEHQPGNRRQNPAYSPPSLSLLERPAGPHARVLAAPPRLRAGQRVALVAPSGPVDPGKLDRGLAWLRGAGLEVVPGEHLLERRGYLAGSDEQRRADLQRAIDDPSVDAILFARGGYGLTRILGALDLSPLLTRPKLVMGFSDITALQLAIAARADLASIHGPMVASNLAREELNGSTIEWMARIVGPGEAGAVVLGERDGLVFRGGGERVTAPLVGGCLTLLSVTLGTPFEIATRGGVLFWEDVGEDLYRLDRLLTHLRMAGKLDGIAGMLVGVPVGVTRERREGIVDDLTEHVAAWLGEAPFPVVTQLPCGHGEPCASLPLGRLVTIDPGTRTVTLPPLPC